MSGRDLKQDRQEELSELTQAAQRRTALRRAFNKCVGQKSNAAASVCSLGCTPPCADANADAA